MATLDREKRPYSFHDDTTDDDTDVDEPKPLNRENENFEEARRIYRTLTSGHHLSRMQEQSRYVSFVDKACRDCVIQHVNHTSPETDKDPGRAQQHLRLTSTFMMSTMYQPQTSTDRVYLVPFYRQNWPTYSVVRAFFHSTVTMPRPMGQPDLIPEALTPKAIHDPILKP